MTFLLPDVKSQVKLAIGVAVALASVGGAIQLHNMRVDQLKASWEVTKSEAVEVVKTQQEAICGANNKLTKDKAHDLQNRYDIIARNYDGLLRVTPDSRNGQPTTSGAAGGGYEASPADLQPMCFTRQFIAMLGRQCDEQTAALITLQDVVGSIYRANGQSELLPK